MDEKITVIKEEMLTLFDQKGKALAVTALRGKELKLGEIFKEGDLVIVSGTSKGKGFAGVVKRYGFAGGPKTHGQSDRQRASGSIGATTTPGRVYRGKRMAGRMGSQKVTVKNLLVAKVDADKNIVYVKGAVPGAKKSALILRKRG